MAIIAIFSGTYCHAEEIVEVVAQKLNYRRIEKKLIEETCRRYDIPEDRLKRAIYGPLPLFAAAYNRERDRYIAFVKTALAELISSDNVLLHGFEGHLLPKTISHILRVCIIANHDYRVTQAAESERISEKEANRRIRKDDEVRTQWTQHLFDLNPWDESLYDVVIPMQATSVQQAVDIVCENANRDAVKTTERSRRAVEDFNLTAQIGVALAHKSQDVEISSEDGNVTIVINKASGRLEHFQEELKQMAGSIPGVRNVRTRIGPKFTEPSMITKVEFEMPRKILLVDDEKEFVHTLSERLLTRNLESSIVYDGEQALSYVANEEPEVMVLDLKMPGIDGIEVLRRVKKEHPNVEVIILTGHGSEKEEALAKELGAFAYLNKPVNIDVLARTMKEAYQKIGEKKAAAGTSQKAGE